VHLKHGCALYLGKFSSILVIEVISLFSKGNVMMEVMKIQSIVVRKDFYFFSTLLQ